MAGLGSVSGARGFHSRVQLEPREGGGGSSTVGREKRRPRLVAAASLSAGESSIRLGYGKAVDREVGNVRCASSRGRRGPRAQGDGEGAHGTAWHVVVVAVRRSTSTCAQWTATRGEVEMLQGGTGARRGLGTQRVAGQVADAGGERRHGEKTEREERGR